MQAGLYSKDVLGTLLRAGATTINMDIYVNDATGDDANDGSVTHPYKTITRAYQDVPYILRHYVHIHIAAATYTDWPLVIDHRYESGSSLSFDGSAAMVDVAAGPYTVDAGPVAYTGTYVVDIPVVGGGLVVNAFRGKQIQFLSGAIIGSIGGILSNTATVIRAQVGYTLPLAGATFKIIEPGVKITVPATPVEIRGNSHERYSLFAIVGIEMSATEPVTFQGAAIVPSSMFKMKNINFMGETFSGSYWGSVPLANFIDNAELRNAIATYWNSVGLIDSNGAGYATLSGSLVDNIASIRSIDVAQGDGYVSMCSISNPDDYGVDAYMIVTYLRVYGLFLDVKNTKFGLRATCCSGVDLSNVYVKKALYGIQVGVGTSVSIGDLTGTDADVANALYVGQGANVQVDMPGCTLVGAGGAGTAVK